MDAQSDRPRRLSPTRKTAERFGVSTRTIQRWRVDPNLNFPKPTSIRGRQYDDAALLDEFELECVRRAADPQRKTADPV
jgi:hypothetical protein